MLHSLEYNLLQFGSGKGGLDCPRPRPSLRLQNKST
jgi:hypothetical protein